MINKNVKDALQKESNPIFIWGYGEVGKLVHDKLNSEGILCKGYVIDDALEDTDDEVCTKQELLAEYDSYVLVKGFLKSFSMSEKEILAMWPGCKGIYSVPDVYEPRIVEELTEEYYEANLSLFQLVHDNLEDDFSRKSFDAYIKAKTTKCAEPLLPYVVTPQYFFEPTPWIACGGGRKPDVLVDCGAFNGDSILDFVDRWGDGYSEIIACEPDPHNYEKLQRTMRDHGVKNVTALQLGLHSCKTTLRFHSTGDMLSVFEEDGEIELHVDTIDNIAAGKMVSIIKMDIEGSEMNALQGARDTMTRCRPMMMISVDHKRDDPFRIYQFINDTVDDYKYYFRCHKPLAIDAVLYAVPIERVGNNDC